ncbi:MAG TPA: hypothetical protein VHO69_07560 [Phototrophicaceae bacterium]|nr:hypothetical protein [Phototrophicaceae bacterium]
MKSKLILLIALFVPMLLLLTIQPGYGQAAIEATPAATVEVAATMDFVPTDCGILAGAIAIDPLIPRAIGAWPVWLSVPNGDDRETKGILYVPNRHNFTDASLPGWWVTKAGWFVSKSYSGEVRVRGFNVADDSPIYFASGAAELSDTMILNPEQPGGFVTGLERFAFFPTHMWVAHAGCYRLEAAWDGGLWQQIIAVGNIE